MMTNWDYWGWTDEKILGPLAGLAAAVILGWRWARRVRVTVAENGNGHQKTDKKARTELLCSIDSSLKVLVDGQKEAIEKLDRMADDVGATRRELAQLWGSVFGSGRG